MIDGQTDHVCKNSSSLGQFPVVARKHQLGLPNLCLGAIFIAGRRQPGCAPPLRRIERGFEIFQGIAAGPDKIVEGQHTVVSLFDLGRHFLQGAVLSQVGGKEAKIGGIRSSSALTKIKQSVAQTDAGAVKRLHRHRISGG